MMLIKVIYATKPTVLTIDLSTMAERFDLLQMGPDGRAVVLRQLTPATKNVVKVGAGVYKVMSEIVPVVADNANSLELSSVVVNSKDDPPPDQPLMATMFDKALLRTFLLDTRSAALPSGAPPAR
jgi:hypothetical protein